MAWGLAALNDMGALHGNDRALACRTNGVDEELTVEQVVARFVGDLGTGLENGVVLEFDGFVAAYADEVVVMVGGGLVDFVALVALGEL